MSHQQQADVMAPDSGAAIHEGSPSLIHDCVDPSALMTLMAIGPTLSPPSTLLASLPNGILSKASKRRKRVSFRDSNLVSVREIPPRSHCGSSSEEEEEEDSYDDEEDSGSSESDEESEESDSEEEEEEGEVRKQTRATHVKPVTTAFRDRAVTVTRSCPSPPASSSPTPRARAHRGSVPTTTTTASAKGSYQVSSNPASRVISLVSQITGVSQAAAQSHIKQRNTASSVLNAAAQPKQMTAVLRVEKKVKKISPNLNSVVTSQPVRSVQTRDRALAMTKAKGGHGKGSKKKRVTHSRKQEGCDKRKPATPRKPKDSTHAANGDVGSVNGVCPERVKYRVSMTGLSSEKNGVSLPPLTTDDCATLHKPLPRSVARKTPIFSVGGFIFPGDPANDLASGVKVNNTKGEDTKLVLKSGGGLPPKERMPSAPPSSPGRRKRYYAWQMANGNLENSLQESPCITPMWETVTPVGSATAKTPSLPNR